MMVTGPVALSCTILYCAGSVTVPLWLPVIATLPNWPDGTEGKVAPGVQAKTGPGALASTLAAPIAMTETMLPASVLDTVELGDTFDAVEEVDPVEPADPIEEFEPAEDGDPIKVVDPFDPLELPDIRASSMFV
jgi:hypothetical protein